MRGRPHFRGQLALTFSAAALVGCGADRATGPDEAARVADEFERAAAEIGFAVGPTAALTYQSAATALRGGARISEVAIAVNGKAETWNAIGHEMRLRTASGQPAYPFEMRPLRYFIAWQRMGSAMRVLHLLAASDDDEIRSLLASDPIEDGDVRFAPTSYLMYAEGRRAIWEAVSGRQTSKVVTGSVPCPQPVRPAGAPPAPQCLEASFSFELMGVEARPFVPPPFATIPVPVENEATGTRTISMASQTIAGFQVTLTVSPFPTAPITGPPRP